ncbi:MAG: hypothetical protein ACI9G1_004740, partial [Pirellulaceae bacterium]
MKTVTYAISMVFLALFAFGDVGVLFSADPGEY